MHLVVLAAGRVIGTCRLVPEADAWRLAEWPSAARGAEREWAGGAPAVVLHAQLTVRGFYARAGYRVEGAEFSQAGIAQFQIRWRPPDALHS